MLHRYEYFKDATSREGLQETPFATHHFKSDVMAMVHAEEYRIKTGKRITVFSGNRKVGTKG